MSSGTGRTDDQLGLTRLRCCGPGSPEEAQARKEGRRSRRERGTALEIPTELCEELSALVASKGFRSVREFVIHLLRDEAARAQLENPGSGYSARELELIGKFLPGGDYVS